MVRYEIRDPQEALIIQPMKNDSYRLKILEKNVKKTVIEIKATAEPLTERTHFKLPTHLKEDRHLFPKDLLKRLKAAQYLHQAVEEVLDWISDHIEYDDTALDREPQSILKNKKAACRGLVNLARYFLDLMGIKTRSAHGVLADTIDREGKARLKDAVFHRWLEVYYDDIGWLPSGPGYSKNFVNAYHIAARINPEILFVLKNPITCLSNLGIKVKILDERQEMLDIDVKKDCMKPVRARKMTHIQYYGTLLGKIETLKGEPLKEGTVMLKGKRRRYTTKLNSAGRFAFYGLDSGMYTLSLAGLSLTNCHRALYVKKGELRNINLKIAEGRSDLGREYPDGLRTGFHQGMDSHE